MVRTRIRAVALLPVAVTLAAALWMHAAPADQLARTLPTEDAYYVLAVARHAAIGDGVTADGRIDTNGFQPLWAAVNVPLYAIAGGDRITGLRLSQLLSTLLWLGFLALLALHARELARRHGGDGRIAASAALILAGGAVSVFRLFHNGLETGLTLVLLAGAVLLLDRWERWTPRRVLAAGVVLGLLCLGRVDEVAFVMAFGAVSVVRAWRAGRPRSALAPLVACAIAALVLSPWIAYNFSLDGSPMPSRARRRARRRHPPQPGLGAARRGRVVGPGGAAPEHALHGDAGVRGALRARAVARRRGGRLGAPPRQAAAGPGHDRADRVRGGDRGLLHRALRPVVVHGALPRAAAAADDPVAGHRARAAPPLAAGAPGAGGDRARRQRPDPRRPGGGRRGPAGVGGARLQPRRAPQPQRHRAARVDRRPREPELRRRAPTRPARSCTSAPARSTSTARSTTTRWRRAWRTAARTTSTRAAST